MCRNGTHDPCVAAHSAKVNVRPSCLCLLCATCCPLVTVDRRHAVDHSAMHLLLATLSRHAQGWMLH
jgi:hypothetical protein